MKLLVTGSSSQPGFKAIVEALKRGHSVTALYFKHTIPLEHENLKKIRIDITNSVALQDLIFKERPDVVLHIAAYGDVDGCEKNKRWAWKVNVGATMVLALAAEDVKAHVIYLSTDYVFDGEKGLYCEEDLPNPVNYYGLTKLMGEVAVMSRCSRWSIVRTSSIYGLGPGRKNFAKFLIERLSKGETVKALVDQFVSPTHANLLAEALLEIAEGNRAGIFHVAGERMNRYEFALKVAEELGFDKSLIKEAKIEEFNWFARRPRDSSLNTSKTAERLRTEFSSTERALSELKREYLSLMRGK